MKASLFALAFPLPLLATTPELTLSNDYLEARTSAETTALLHFYGKRGSGVNQFQKAQEGSGFLASLGGGGNRQEGLQAAIRLKDGTQETLSWKLEEQAGEALRFRDVSGRFEALLSLPPGASAVDLTIQSLSDASAYESLELIWTLQIGGDFLAVTTEGVADRDVIPSQNEKGSAFLHLADIERDESRSFVLAQPWFVITDKNQAVTFAVSFEAPGEIRLSSWSGQLLGSESMSRTLSFPAAAAPIHVRMMLLEPLLDITAIIKEGAIFWNASDTLQFVPSARIPKGELRLIATPGEGGERRLLATPIADWSPLKPQAFRIGDLPSPVSALELKVELQQGEEIRRLELLKPRPQE